MFDTLLAKGFTIFAQVTVKIQPLWGKYKAPFSLVAGILIGWFAIGWGIAPVEWTNATPGHLREDYKSAYIAYASQEFYSTGDLTLLQSRLGLDLPDSSKIPWLAEEGLLLEDVTTAMTKAHGYQLDSYMSALNGVQQIVMQEQGLPIPAEVPEAETGTEESTGEATPLAKLLRIGAIGAVALLVLGAAGVAWYLLTGRNRTSSAGGTAMATGPDVITAEPGVGVSGTDLPVKSFNTPYVLGDDYFDPSFSIEIGSDFMGECGIGISETIGAGEPKKVTAFEAWLFDKSDIRTVTKVLATQYAYNDPDLRAKLEPKGDIVLLSPGQEIVLETSALRVKARIKEIEYAQGASLPPSSFVQKVSFEVQAWVKQGDEIGTS
jgi:hypothetical protein